MSKRRQLTDLLDTGGDVLLTHLGNLSGGASDYNTMTGVPSWATSATTNTTSASNISSGLLAQARISSSSGSSSNWLNGGRGYTTACSNHAACTTSNCACACACNC